MASDLELLDSFRKGDESAFNELMRRYQEKVYWLARRIVGTHEDADDIVQDVFVRAHSSLPDFRGDSNLYTWLYRVATNHSLNALRKKKIKDFIRYDSAIEESVPGNEHADTETLQTELRRILERAIDRLPPRQKQVFILRYYDELSFVEMAKLLGKSEGGLKANYFHALKKIQAYVREQM